MTSGQETGRVYSYNPGARMGPIASNHGTYSCRDDQAELA